MKHEEKINYMRIAAGICGFGFSNEQMDLLVCLYEQVISKGGDADLKGLSRIESEVKKRAELSARKERLNKVSKSKK
jgi:hypothetical protein